MYGFKFAKNTLLISQAIVLLGSVIVNPAVGQGLNFVDLNQSRQFFDGGNRRLEREIETLEENKSLQKIKLPQDYQKSSIINKLNSLDTQHKLKLMSYSAIYDRNDSIATEFMQ